MLFFTSSWMLSRYVVEKCLVIFVYTGRSILRRTWSKVKYPLPPESPLLDAYHSSFLKKEIMIPLLRCLRMYGTQLHVGRGIIPGPAACVNGDASNSKEIANASSDVSRGSMFEVPKPHEARYRSGGRLTIHPWGLTVRGGYLDRAFIHMLNFGNMPICTRWKRKLAASAPAPDEELIVLSVRSMRNVVDTYNLFNTPEHSSNNTEAILCLWNRSSKSLDAIEYLRHDAWESLVSLRIMGVSLLDSPCQIIQQFREFSCRF